VEVGATVIEVELMAWPTVRLFDEEVDPPNSALLAKVPETLSAPAGASVAVHEPDPELPDPELPDPELIVAVHRLVPPVPPA
jgi:hypothetical protein